MLVVQGVVVGHSGLPGVDLGATEGFGIYLLSGGRPHQRRSG